LAKYGVRGSSDLKSIVLQLVIAGLGIAVPSRAFAQTMSPPMEAGPPSPPAAPFSPPPVVENHATRMVGGHIGVAVPLVAFHINQPEGAKGTTTISDQFTIAVPIGIGVHLSPDWIVDFESIVANDVSPWGAAGLTIDPGVVYTGLPVALGLRVKFDVAPLANANVGIIPLVNKGLVPIGDGMWFVEAAFPITATKTQDLSIAIVAHTGIGF
jgi:hypothetical protein